MKTIFSLIFLCSILSAPIFAQSPSLRINEVSNGTSGSKEYVELIVIGQASTGCNPQTLDLRGWILDDNNGRFASGSGKGIASGAVRFSTNTLWSAVPVGTLILIYNGEDFDAAIIPAEDISLTDGNCRIVTPVSANLFEKNSSPTQTSANYPTSGWTAGGDWTNMGLANSDDSFQIYTPTNTTVPVHAVSYGNNSQNNIIYFAGTGAGKVYSCMNTSSNDYALQSNWVSANATTGQTPGLPNNTQNATYINSLNPTCAIASAPFTVTVTPTNVSCNATCNGTAIATTNGGQAPFTYLWSNGQTSTSLSNLCAGSYDVTVVDATGCEAQTTFNVLDDGNAVVDAGKDTTICLDQIYVFAATGATQYSWNNGATNGGDFTSQVVGTFTFDVTGTSGTCTDVDQLIITVIDCSVQINDTVSNLEMPNVFTPNGDLTNDVYEPSFSTGVAIKDFVIMNRWGNEVFQVNDPVKISWDGKTKAGIEATEGVYFYLVTYVDLTGTTKKQQGFLHLIRSKS